MNTRYNVYYNGNKHYQEQIKILENDYQDDYSTQLFIHPAEAYSNPKATQPSTNFDRTIEKMQKAISLHSIKRKPKRKGNSPKQKEWLKREEYNPFIHNAWYLMAKAQYMKGDFLSSAATFHYIARHFQWKPELVLESQIWEALSYCAMDWTTEADNVLVHIHPERIENERLNQLANLAFADYYIKCKMNAEAVPYLEKAVKGAGGGQKVRLYFLLGQLYDETGEKEKAYQAYKRAGSSSNSTYRTKFNARIKQSAVFQGNNIDGEVKALKRMTRYDRNKEYLDQIYYAIGNLYLTRGDTVKAVENYELAAKKSTRNGIDKAISQLALGGIYFAQHKYDKAQPCYSEAIPQLSESYPNYKELKHRSDVLDELAVYSGNVTLQDSLLRLSQMPLEEQKKVIAKIIEELKKKEKEEKEAADREAYLASQQGNSGLKSNAKQPASYNINTDNSWYFYNTATKNAGKTAFQQQWGNRKLEDNWRRRNKNTFSLDENIDENNDSIAAGPDSLTGDSAQVDKEALKRAEDPHYEEYYLKQIPKTEEEIQTSNDVIQEGLYNMGVILKDKLEDLPAAAYEFERLLERYPDNTYRLDTYYNMYLLYQRSRQYSDAERYRQLILSNFPESKYGMAMQDPNYLENLKRMNLVQEELYDQAYTAYLNNDNAIVHQAYADMMRTYPLSKIMPKFMFIDALAYVTERNPEMFKKTLREMLERYPETDITPTASSMVKQLNQGRKINGGSKNTRGMLWSMRLSTDSAGNATDREFTPFTEGRNKPQLFVLVFSTDSVSANQLLYEVAKHNFSSFVMKDFELEPMSFGNLGLIVVKGFANYPEIEHYRGVWEKDEEKVIPPQVHYVIISQDNFDLLLREGRTFEEYFRYLDELNEEKVEEQIPEDAVDDDKADGDDKAEKKEEKADDKQDDKKENKEDEKPAEKPATVQPQQPPGESQLLEEARRRAELRQLEEQRKQEEARKKEEAKRQEEARKREEARQREEELLRQQDEAKRQEEAMKAAEQGKKQDGKDSGKEEKDNVRHLKKQKDAEQKEKERQEKEARKAEKARQDSIKKVEKQREKELRAAEKAKEDSIKAAEEAREKEKEQAAKAAEQERKDKIKAKEEARKQREQERKQRAKEREQKKKEEQKRKKEEAKARKEAAKQRQKEREEARKQREHERKEAARQREQERKAAKGN